MKFNFGPPLEALAERVGIPVDRVEARAEVAATTRAITIAAGDIGEGCVAAQRTIVSAMDGDRELLAGVVIGFAKEVLEVNQ